MGRTLFFLKNQGLCPPLRHEPASQSGGGGGSGGNGIQMRRKRSWAAAASTFLLDFCGGKGCITTFPTKSSPKSVKWFFFSGPAIMLFTGRNWILNAALSAWYWSNLLFHAHNLLSPNLSLICVRYVYKRGERGNHPQHANEVSNIPSN